MCWASAVIAPMHPLADKRAGSRTSYWVRFVNGVSAEATSFYGGKTLSVSENWRVIFRFDNGYAVDVDYLDYH